MADRRSYGGSSNGLLMEDGGVHQQGLVGAGRSTNFMQLDKRPFPSSENQIWSFLLSTVAYCQT